MNQRKPALLCYAFLLTLLAAPVLHASNLYWDSNDVTDGAGTNPDGTWDSSPFWSTDPLGQSAAGAWVDGSTAVFSAGTDATNSFTVTIAGTVNPAAVFVEEGIVTNVGGSINFSSGTSEINVSSAATNIVLSTVSGSGAQLLKTGPGLLTLGTNSTQANTFDGGIIVAGGVLSFPGEGSSSAGGSANALGTYPNSAQASHIVISNNATLRSTATGVSNSFVFDNRGITLGDGGGVIEVTYELTNIDYLVDAGNLTGPGSLTKTGAGTLYLQSPNNDYLGATTNKAGFLGLAPTYTYGKGTLYLTGGGLTACNTNATGFPITNAFVMSANTTLRANSTLTAGSRAVIFSNIWNLTAGTLTIQNLGAAGTLFTPRFFVGGWTNTRPVSIASGCRLDFYNENTTPDIYFTGTISGSGNIRRSINNDGNGGVLVLSGANTYSGGTSNNGGFLGFGRDTAPVGATGSGITSGPVGKGTLTINDDSKVGFFASGGPRIIGNTIAFGTVKTNMYVGTNDITFTGAVTLNSQALVFNVTNTGTTTFSGNIAGGSSTLKKRGNGKLVFSGSNSFPNAITVEAGSLFANNTVGGGLSTNTVTVNSGATLGGSGILSNAVTCNGILSPGDSIGTLTVRNGLNLGAGTYLWQLGTNSIAAGSADKVAVTAGTITLGGTSKLSINFTNQATAPNLTNVFWRANHSWPVVSISGGSNSGNLNFTTLQNATYAAGNFTTSVDGSGNVTLNFTTTYVTPPPPTINAALTGAGTTSNGLSWSSTNGAIYEIQYKTDLNQTNWISLTTITANGATTSFTNTNAPSTNCFYRVIAQ